MCGGDVIDLSGFILTSIAAFDKPPIIAGPFFDTTCENAVAL